MVSDKNRRPIYSECLEDIKWKDYGRSVRLDPSVISLLDNNVYRYASIAETLLLCDGKISFGKPDKWPDKYEAHLIKQLFSEAGPFAKAVPYVKCFSVEYSSEAMWRTYSGSGGLTRVGIKLLDLINGLDSAKWPSDAKIFVGRVKYMEAAKIRSEIATLCKTPPGATMNNAMPALLMKRSGFSFENEVRIAYLPRARKDTADFITASKFPVEKVSKILLDPYLPKWQTDELQKLFLKKLNVQFKVHRSSFDEHPADLDSF